VAGLAGLDRLLPLLRLLLRLLYLPPQSNAFLLVGLFLLGVDRALLLRRLLARQLVDGRRLLLGVGGGGLEELGLVVIDAGILCGLLGSRRDLGDHLGALDVSLFDAERFGSLSLAVLFLLLASR